MSIRSLVVVGLGLAVAGAFARAEPVPPGSPILRIDGGGPTAQVTALAFGQRKLPNGDKTLALYAAGYDKVVRFWTFDTKKQEVTLGPHSYRVPVGPGVGGVLNALAVSPDGRWLAVTGFGVGRGEAGFEEQGRIYPPDALTPTIQQDRAAVFLFDTHSRNRDVYLLRGPTGVGCGLAFAPEQKGKAPLLVSATRDPKTQTGQLCLWDVSHAGDEGGGKLAALTLEGLSSSKPPDLAVRHIGDALKQVRVGVAWGDGKFRVWDAASGKLTEAKDGLPDWNTLAAPLPAPGEWLTGGYDGKGYLRSWREGKEQALVADKPERVLDADYAGLVPVALKPLPEAAGGGGRAAAVFLAVPRAKAPKPLFQLRVISVPGLRTHGTVDLWERAPSDPCLAASPDGRRLAVAGAGSDGVRVFEAEDVLANRNKYQQLTSQGTSIGSLAFVRKKGALGLRLSESPVAFPGQAGPMTKTDLVLDPANRSLVRDPAGQRWTSADPAAAGWKLEVPKDLAKQPVFRWTGPKDQKGEWAPHPDPREPLTAVALVPPSKQRPGPPLLAVASWNLDRGEPLLRILNAENGNVLRYCNGHVQRLGALAASDDGRFLASAAADQTVSLWSLTDLDKIRGKHGTLAGLQLEADAATGALVVKGKNPPRGLATGDRISGLALEENGKPAEGLTPFAFYDTLWLATPRERVWLHLERNGGKREKVAVVVGQASDECKPLLTFFLAGEKGAVPEWIAWTPSGLFDSGGRKIEQLVGWHFNPTAADKPVQFAPIKQYREKFQKRQLLELVMQHADLGLVRAALDRIKAIPAAKASLQVVGVGLENLGRDEFLVRQPKFEVRLTIRGPLLREEEVASAALEIDGGEPLPFDLVADATGQTLSRSVTVKGRGEHTLRAIVRTKNPDHAPAQTEATVRYHLPRPTIVVEHPEPPHGPLGAFTVVRKMAFRLRAPAPAGARFSLVEIGGKKISELPKNGLDEPLQLLDGERTTIRLKAVPRDARPEDELYEEAERTLVVLFQKQESPTPLFTEVELRPGTARARRLAVDPSKPTIVDTLRLRVLGKVTAPEKLSLVELRTTGGALVVAAKPPLGKLFNLDALVTLENRPGQVQEFVLSSKSDNSDASKTELRVVYRPPLPVLEVENLPSPKQGPDRKGAADLTLKGFVRPQDLFHPFDVLIRVSPAKAPAGAAPLLFEKKFTDPVAGEDGAVELGTFRIGPGDNRVEVSVRNAWRPESRVGGQHVVYHRPPFVLDLEASKPGNKPFTTVTAQVDTPSDLPLTQVVLNGRGYDPKAVTTSQKEDAERKVTVWTLRVKDVALSSKGLNPLRLEVRNADGEARRDGTVELLFNPSAPKAQIKVRSLLQVEQPRYELNLRVQSPSTPQHVALKQPGESLAQSLTVGGQREDEQGRFYEFKETLDLREGPNLFVIDVENEGGAVTQEATVTYVPRPVRLLIEPPADVTGEATVALTGRIVWTDARRDEEITKHYRDLRVYVNGFCQSAPKQLDARGPRSDRPSSSHELAFTVSAMLNLPRNEIRVEVPGLPLEDGGNQVFKVVCRKPRPPDGLRLLAVNAGERQIGVEQLTELTRATLQLLGPAAPRAGVRRGRFGATLPYPSADGEIVPLASHITRDTVEQLLNQLQQDTKANDLMLIYWAGRVGIYRGDPYLLTSDCENQPSDKWLEKAIPLRRLLTADALGARVVLLDTSPVAGAEKADLSQWVDGPVAVLRREWTEGGVAQPGLLVALGEVGKSGATLRDVVEAARRLAGKDRQGSVSHNLLQVPALADFPLTEVP